MENMGRDIIDKNSIKSSICTKDLVTNSTQIFTYTFISCIFYTLNSYIPYTLLPYIPYSPYTLIPNIPTYSNPIG